MKRFAFVAIFAGLVAGGLLPAMAEVVTVETDVVRDFSVHRDLIQELTSLMALRTGGVAVQDCAPAIAAKATSMLSDYTELSARQANEIRQFVGEAYWQSPGAKSRGASWFADILSNTSTSNAADKAIRRHAKFMQGVCTGATNTSSDKAAAVTLLHAAFDMPKADETTLTREDWEIAKWWGRYANGGSWTGTASAAILEDNLVLNQTATNFASDYPRNAVLCEVITGKFKDPVTGAWSVTGTAAATNANVYLEAHPFDENSLNTATYALTGWLALATGDDMAAARSAFRSAFLTLATADGDVNVACETLAALPDNLFGEQNHRAMVTWLKEIRSGIPVNEATQPFLDQLNARLGHER